MVGVDGGDGLKSDGVGGGGELGAKLVAYGCQLVFPVHLSTCEITQLERNEQNRVCIKINVRNNGSFHKHRANIFGVPTLGLAQLGYRVLGWRPC